MILALLLLLALLYVPWFYLTKVNKKRDEAPGPYPYPFVGNLHQIFKHEKVVFRALHNMAVKYGPVVTLWFGGKKQVVVSGVEELKEMMHNPAFDGRSWPQKKQVIDEIYTGQTSDINPHNLGVLFASGECWQVLRRFSLRSLRDNGFGKQVAEMYILEEAQYLMDYLRQRIKENPVVTNLDQIFTMMALNIVWQMAAGERFNFDEEGMVQLLTFEQDINETFWSIIFSPLIVMPFLKHLPPMKNVVSNATRKMKKLHSFFDKTIEQHRNSFDGNNIRDVIDAFIAQEASSTKSAHFDQANLRVLLSDLFLAGSETTGKTMEWACLFMILYPEVQHKVQMELDSTIGSSEITASHRSKLAYTEATLYEVMRCGPVGPIAAVRCPKEDCKVGQFVIPAGTPVFPNLYSMTKDPRLWGDDVNEFRPERFISKDGKSFSNPWWDFTFGTGRRKCLGEPVARVETFLFFANLLNNFKLELPNGCPKPKQDILDGMTIGPAHFSIQFSTRMLRSTVSD